MNPDCPKIQRTDENDFDFENEFEITWFFPTRSMYTFYSGLCDCKSFDIISCSGFPGDQKCQKCAVLWTFLDLQPNYSTPLAPFHLSWSPSTLLLDSCWHQKSWSSYVEIGNLGSIQQGVLSKDRSRYSNSTFSNNFEFSVSFQLTVFELVDDC